MDKSELLQFNSKLTDDGSMIYRVHYEREVLMGAKEGTLKTRVVHRGKELGSATIAFPDD
jgi:hypothetical protein